MNIYDLLVGEPRLRVLGRIWCTDGSFLPIDDDRIGTKVPFGYVINDSLAIPLRIPVVDNDINWGLAALKCKVVSNAGVYGHLPSTTELLNAIGALRYRNNALLRKLYILFNMNSFNLPDVAKTKYYESSPFVWTSNRGRGTDSSEYGYYAIHEFSMECREMHAHRSCNRVVPFYSLK